MPTYTVHAAIDDRDDDRIAFVRDGFSWSAFVFGALWFARHRLWIVLASYLALVVVLVLAMIALKLPVGARLLITLLLAALTGFEAASLRRWKLSRGRWRQRDLVVAASQEEAERRFFERPRESVATPRAPQQRPQTPPAASSSDAIIGLFPEPGGTR